MGLPLGLLRLGGLVLLHPLFLFCACQDDDNDGKNNEAGSCGGDKDS